jgi:hypothetical protein
MGKKHFGNGNLERENLEIKIKAWALRKETVVELV